MSEGIELDPEGSPRDGEEFHGREPSLPEGPSPASPARRRGRPRTKASEGGRFVGTRVSPELYRRLYMDKARLEMETGGFYGISRLMERALRRGLAQIERELDRRGLSSDPYGDEHSAEHSNERNLT